MIFKHELLPQLYLNNIDDGPNGRIYQTPIGDLPSVTAVLDSYGNKKGLDDWREWIDGRDGEGTAAGITHKAKMRGTEVHTIAEQYLNNNPNWKKGIMPFNLGTFLKIKGVLDANVTSIYGLEYPVYSQQLRTAGRVDIIGSWNNIDAVLDLKTSLKPIKPEGEKAMKWFYQTTAYAICLEERYKKPFEQCIILAMVDKESEPQLFIFNNLLYRNKVKEIFINR